MVAELDIILMMPILKAVSSAKHIKMREHYQHEIPMATTPKRPKKVYQPIYHPKVLLARFSGTSDHQSTHIAVVLDVLVSVRI